MLGGGFPNLKSTARAEIRPDRMNVSVTKANIQIAGYRLCFDLDTNGVTYSRHMNESAFSYEEGTHQVISCTATLRSRLVMGLMTSG